MGSKSHLTVEGLLAKPAAETLSTLLEYQPTNAERFEGYDRCGMLNTVAEAVKENVEWGLELADLMAESGKWNSDLWPQVIRAWTETEMEQGQLIRVLSHLSADELHQQHTRGIANTLSVLARQAREQEFKELLLQANAIATALQQYATKVEVPNVTSSIDGASREFDWLFNAINHPSGKLADFGFKASHNGGGNMKRHPNRSATNTGARWMILCKTAASPASSVG